MAAAVKGAEVKRRVLEKLELFLNELIEIA
jgi:hypothetical protein